MIYIKETDHPSAKVISNAEKTIGVTNNNNADVRVFSLPKTFKGLDFADDNYEFTLQIQPVNQKEKPYPQALEKEILEDEVRLTWKITRTHTKDTGQLSVSILARNEADDIVWQSFTYGFYVVKGIYVKGSAAANEIVVGERLAVEVNDNGRLQRAMDQAAGGTLRIPSGVYYIDLAGASSHGVTILSDTDVVMEPGTILQAIATDADKYAILDISNQENVSITGGTILGDRYTHTGTTGEHGMGINIDGSKNVTIDGVKIKDCWGDCIYVGDYGMGGKYAKDIVIRDCVLDGSRRQGISLTLCDGVIIENCMLLNIKGTAPQAGIDIETNSSSRPCRDITIRGCYFSGSAGGGLKSYNRSENIQVIACTFVGDQVIIRTATNIKVIDCTLYNADCTFIGCEDITEEGNILENSSIVVSTS